VKGEGLERLEAPAPSIISAGFKEDTIPCWPGSWAIEHNVDHASLSHIDDKIQEPLARLLRQLLDRYVKCDEEVVRSDNECTRTILKAFWNHVVLPGSLIIGVIYFFSRVSGLLFIIALGIWFGMVVVLRGKHVAHMTKLLFLLTLLFWSKYGYFGERNRRF
jgi:hypothetical protein